jgi:hypothetical protein
VNAAASKNTATLAPGHKLDRYELLCPIAEGGMASVWVARQRGKHGFEKLVAIKTILPVFANDARFQEMFLDEARIASRIDHPNVAHILDLGEEQDVLYLAMEYVDGDSLSKLNHACVKEGMRIPAGVLLRVLADACAGLHEAHEQIDSDGGPLEIVHRDVSPHNILVSTRGMAKLIDFGIAKARSRAGGETNSGVLKGKVHYMAPEQALGKVVDRRADLWSIGVTLYYLLSGRPPYEGENQLATLHLLSSGQPPPPLPQTVHPAIAAVVRKALAHAPENRHQTANELRTALEQAMIRAGVPTAQADVAALLQKYLGDRAEKRRSTIDAALAAATERRRIADLLRPANEVGAARGSVPPPALSSHAILASQEATSAEVPVAKEASPHSRSYATLGSASFDASELAPQARSRRPLVLVLGACALTSALIVALAMLRPKHEPRASIAASPPPSVAPAMLAPPGTIGGTGGVGATKTTAPPGAFAGNTSATPTIPVIAPSSLPKANDVIPPPRAADEHRNAPAAARPAAPAPTTPTPPKARPSTRPQAVDDGF